MRANGKFDLRTRATDGKKGQRGWYDGIYFIQWYLVLYVTRKLANIPTYQSKP